MPADLPPPKPSAIARSPAPIFISTFSAIKFVGDIRQAMTYHQLTVLHPLPNISQGLRAKTANAVFNQANQVRQFINAHALGGSIRVCSHKLKTPFPPVTLPAGPAGPWAPVGPLSPCGSCAPAALGSPLGSDGLAGA